MRPLLRVWRPRTGAAPAAAATALLAAYVRDRLDAAGEPYSFAGYGNGSGWGSCDGGHGGLCWAQDLVDYVPKVEQALASS